MNKEYELEFVTKVGLNAYIWKHPTYGSYCGYVDRYHVKQSLDHLEVHGGVTYEDELLVGFDCNHIDDLPDPETHKDDYYYRILDKFYPDATFKDIEFVKNECEHLAKQVNDVYCGVLTCMTA